MKEHAAIVIMASSASVSATSTLVIAAQKLYYGGYPNVGGAVFITMATQRMCSSLFAAPPLFFRRTHMGTDSREVIGYGLAGMMRRVLLWPTKMLYPENLPITTVLETLHRDKAGNKKRMKVFWMIFAALLAWEIVPEVGISFVYNYDQFLITCSICLLCLSASRSSALQTKIASSSQTYLVARMEMRV
jgi:hypothetical protein